MKTSIVIPAYNCGSTLENTIHSILLCGIKDYEILIIDDGSKDNTGNVCDRLIQAHSCIRCIHTENHGVSSARNIGISNAKGDYIWFVDADDTVEKDSLEKILRYLDEKLDIIIFGACFDYYNYGRCYRSEAIAPAGQHRYREKEWEIDFESLFSENLLSPVWNKIIRRQLLIENDIRFNEQMVDMEDFLFSVQCMGKANSIACLPDVVYRYRQTENEMNTFYRLLKIPSITSYTGKLECSVNRVLYPKENHFVAQSIYLQYFMELLRFGDIETIQKTCEDMLNGKYAPFISQNQPVLYDYAFNKKYIQIHRYFLKRRLRHKAAVLCKSILSFGRKRNEKR